MREDAILLKGNEMGEKKASVETGGKKRQEKGKEVCGWKGREY